MNIVEMPEFQRLTEAVKLAGYVDALTAVSAMLMEGMREGTSLDEFSRQFYKQLVDPATSRRMTLEAADATHAAH